MITTEDIESIGWKHRATTANGGSKMFVKDLEPSVMSPFVIQNNSDNFIYKQNNDKRLNEIEIQEIVNLRFVTRYKGEPKNLEELKNELKKLGLK